MKCLSYCYITLLYVLHTQTHTPCLTFTQPPFPFIHRGSRDDLRKVARQDDDDDDDDFDLVVTSEWAARFAARRARLVGTHNARNQQRRENQKKKNIRIKGALMQLVCSVCFSWRQRPCCFVVQLFEANLNFFCFPQ